MRLPHTTVIHNDEIRENFEELEDYLDYLLLASPISGNITTVSEAAVPMTGGPSLKIPVDGHWLVGISIFMQQQAEGLTGMEVFIMVNGGGSGIGVSGKALYEVGRQTFDGGIRSAEWPAVLKAGNVLSVDVATSGKVSAGFASACITAKYLD